jgi:hypothetical protein
MREAGADSQFMQTLTSLRSHLRMREAGADSQFMQTLTSLRSHLRMREAGADSQFMQTLTSLRSHLRMREAGANDSQFEVSAEILILRCLPEGQASKDALEQQKINPSLWHQSLG